MVGLRGLACDVAQAAGGCRGDCAVAILAREHHQELVQIPWLP